MLEKATIDYESPGQRCVFVSNDATGLRNPDRLFCNQWADEGLPTGDLDSFWSPETITSQDFFMEAMILAGERRPGVGFEFAMRSPQTARARADRRWTTLVHTSLTAYLRGRVT